MEKFDYEEFGAQLAFERDYPNHTKLAKEDSLNKNNMTVQQKLDYIIDKLDALEIKLR